MFTSRFFTSMFAAGASIFIFTAPGGAAFAQETSGALATPAAPSAPVRPGYVHVSFINSGNGQTIATSDMPVEKMPESFEVNTTLTLPGENGTGEKWAVLSAEPVTKTAFARTGRLTLMLARVLKDKDSAPEIYAVPTVAGDLGKPTGALQPEAEVFTMHEGDWRQVEFVAGPYEKEMMDELADIQDIRAKDALKQGGYSKMHERKRIPEPVLNFSLANTEASIPQLKRFKGVGFTPVKDPDAQVMVEAATLPVVPRSFAWKMDEGLVLWGATDEGGNVTRLCLSGMPQKDHVAAVSDLLAKFTDKYNLFLVDWVKGVRIRGGDEAAFEKYFSGK